MEISEVFTQAVLRLQEAGIHAPALDAQLLMAHALGLSRTDIMLKRDKYLDSNEVSMLHAAVARRSQHEPIAYITGKKEFWSLDFCVTRDTLIPRPDSETLVETALKKVRGEKPQNQAKPITLLDIGTGTGCLLIALLSELPAAGGTGLDNSERALRVAGENAKRHGVQPRATFIRSHWCDALQGTFDLIVSNPPYIAESARSALMPDVRDFEPGTALFAGADGLDAYRALAPQVAQHLNPGGYVLFEVGEWQARGVEALLQEQGLKVETAQRDLAGIERCVVASKAG